MRISDLTQVDTSLYASRSSQQSRRLEMQQKMLNLSAEVLGISADDLKTQLESGKDLESIVKASGMSEDEFRTSLDEAIQKAGMPPPPPPPPQGQRGPDSAASQKLAEMIADKLEISTDELKTQLDSGKTISELLEDKGVSEDDLLSALESALGSWQPYDQSGAVSSRFWAPNPFQVDATG